MRFLLILAFTLITGIHANGVASDKPLYNSLMDKILRDDQVKYQIGSEWGKKEVTSSSINEGTSTYKQAALQTFKVYFKQYSFLDARGIGTSFYLGKFKGEHVFATNYHVLHAGGGTESICAKAQVEGLFLQRVIRFQCKKTLGSWTDVDLALFTAEVSAQDEHLIEGLGRNFAFNSPVYAGQELLTTGFGIGFNSQMKMVSNADSDCIVFSPEIRYMADPDDLNPGPYKAWSFSNGCDVSHGDSGSAMLDRNTGEIVGIIWTGRIPKDEKVRDPEYLSEIFESQSEEIWKQLSYAAPATKIHEVVLEALNSPTMPNDTKVILEDVLN